MTECYRTNKEKRQFFKEQGIMYLERTRIAWEPLLKTELDKSLYYIENEEE